MTRIVLMLLLAILALLVLGLAHGDYAVPLHQVIGALKGDPGVPPEAVKIVMETRLPRLVLCLLVGLPLGMAGVIAQSMMRNPLAEPGLLGINSGAGLAAMLLIVGARGASEEFLPAACFAGAAAMALAIYILSWRHGTSSMRIILIGIGLGALAGAATSFLSAFGDIRDVQRAMIWLSGTFYDSNWTKAQILLAWTALPMALAWIGARELDLMSFGDVTARGLGQRVNLVRGAMMIICTLLSGAAVAAAGLIGFVGLVAPHMARRLAGHGHARLLPTAALIGGLMVMFADFAGRTIIAPAELPAGLMTALIGAPFFGWLMWERRHVAA